MKTILKTLTILLIISWTISASAQVTVTHSFVNNSAFEVFFLKDFDINSPASGPPIFLLAIKNDTQQRCVIIDLKLKRKTDVSSLFEGETIPFDLDSNEILPLTSNQIITNTGKYRLDDFRINREDIEELLDNILATGKLPSDIYTFKVEVKDVACRLCPQQVNCDNDNQGQVSDPVTFDIRVSNPKRVDIIGPGNPVTGSVRDCERIFSNLPQFRWASRMKIFRFILAEYAPGEDPENALNNEPRFTRIFVIGNGSRPANLAAGDLGFNDGIEQLPSNAFQYPASGTSLPLKPGKTYVYQLVGLVNSSSGFFTTPSEIYCFKIPQLGQLGAGRQQFELILRSLLESDYEKLFGENGELAEYQPRGMTMDGKEVTLTEILTRLQQLKSKYSGYLVE